MDIGIIFASAFPDDSNVESRLKLTGPSGVIMRQGITYLKKMSQSGRGGDALLEKISRINQLSLIQYSHAMQNRQYRKRLLFKKGSFMYVTGEAH